MNGFAIPQRIFSFLLNTISQRDEKQHTAGLDDTVIQHIKS